MATTIKLKRSAVPNNVPTVAQLELGEIAINTYDGKLYIKKDTGTESIVLIGPAPAAVADPGSNGIVVRTSSTTAVTRTITGTTNQITISNGDGISGNPVISLSSDPVLPGTGAVTVPSGTTAQRPASPTSGMIRYNSTLNKFEGYENGAWTNIIQSGGTPAGSNTEIQFNNSGAFGADPDFTWNSTNNTLTIGNVSVGGTIISDGLLTIQTPNSSSFSSSIHVITGNTTSPSQQAGNLLLGVGKNLGTFSSYSGAVLYGDKNITTLVNQNVSHQFTPTKLPANNVFVYSHDSSNPNDGSFIGAARVRSTLASPASLIGNDRIGFFIFSGWTGSAHVNTAGMEGVASSNWTATSAATHLNFYTTPSSSVSRVNRFTISEAGNITIYTPDSGTALTVNAISGGVATRWTQGTVNLETQVTGTTGYVGTSSNHTLAFITNNIVQMNIDNTGNINIGPRANPRVFISNNSGSASTMVLGADSGATFIGTTTNSHFDLYSNGSLRARISNGGVFTVGTTTASSDAFEIVRGSNTATVMRFFQSGVGEWWYGMPANSSTLTWGINSGYGTTRMTLDTSGNLTAAGNITAYSDKRLKTNIKPLKNALEKITSLTGVSFTRTDTNQQGIGLIAQDVQEVFPEVVIEAEDEQKTLSIAYGNLIGPLIEAIKELKAENNLLKQQIVALEKKIEKIID